jgi:hypothetical protein
MSALARTWSSPTAAQPLGRPHQAPLRTSPRPLRFTDRPLLFQDRAARRTGEPAGRQGESEITDGAVFPDGAKLERRLQETAMHTTDQKATILRRAGVAVPAFPARRPSDQQHQAGAESTLKSNLQAEGRRMAAEQWARTIDTLFVEYSAARAARSLRDAEEARQLGALRRASDGSTA